MHCTDLLCVAGLSEPVGAVCAHAAVCLCVSHRGYLTAQHGFVLTYVDALHTFVCVCTCVLAPVLVCFGESMPRGCQTCAGASLRFAVHFCSQTVWFCYLVVGHTLVVFWAASPWVGRLVAVCLLLGGLQPCLCLCLGDFAVCLKCVLSG